MIGTRLLFFLTSLINLHSYLTSFIKLFGDGIFSFRFNTQNFNSTEEKKEPKLNITALGIQTNYVDPEGFLNEISTLDKTAMTKEGVDADFLITEAPTKEETDEKTLDFIRVLCLWC